MSPTVLSRLDARVVAGEAQPDLIQQSVAARLDALAVELQAWRPAKGRGLANLFGSRKPAPKGMYIWGKVGRGKTMLMDLFFATTPFEPKRRIHFYEFMAEVHDRIADARERLPGDPIPLVAASIASGARLLCFDELHVTDIADAMILGRLFAALFEHQVVIVSTSNVAPEGLYRDGLNRSLFLPFIDLLAAKSEVVELVAAKDYRLEKLSGHQLYFSPLDDAARRAMRAAFTRVTGVWHGKPMDLEVKGRLLRVPEQSRGAALFDFAELCMQPLGPLDYLAIAHEFHTVLIANVPQLDRQRRAEARRFINLIDTLYDARVGLIVSAAVEPDDIYPKGDEAFLFERTASRLIEMRSDGYLGSRADRTGTAASASALAG